MAFAGMKRKCPESCSTLWPSSSRINYEVFLNFRGADTREFFTDLLHRDLKNAGIEVFKDDEKLLAGEEIDRGLKDAIKRSRISIAIFSKDYASSKSCLMELEKMWECRQSYGQIIIPIFYDVSPHAVKHQTGDFATSFEKHEKDDKVDSNTIQKWKEVLQQVGGLTGYEREKINGRRVTDLLDEVVTRVWQALRKDDQVVTDKLVGIDLHVQEMMTKLGVVYSHGQAMKVCGEDVRVVGICGMPGVGKTTLAKVVFNKIHKLFDECSFLNGVNSEEVQISQQLLIADLQKGKPEPVRSSGKGIKKIKSLFNNMKVLIVLDDVREVEQIEALVGDLTCFGPGSRIIVTTHRRDVLNVLDFGEDKNRAAKEYEVKPMEHQDALQLFRKHVFQGDAPQDVSECDSLSPDIVEALGRLPMAIELQAKYLKNNKKIQFWKSSLKSLQKYPLEEKLEAALDASYKSLDDCAKKIFLDIACFFIGKDERIPPYMWEEAWDGDPLRKIKHLRDMHFLEDGENNELRMHDLLRDYGRKLVKSKDLHERCRIWNHRDALSILKDGQGTKSVEGIGLTVEEGCPDSFNCEQFWEMSNLRYLRLDRAKIQGDTTKLPQNLRWLDWRECHSIPELCNMHLRELVILDLSWSPVAKDSQIWSRFMEVEKLKVLNLQGCVLLGASLNLPAPINLEMLILEDCSRLSQIRQFICDLKQLSSLNLRNCSQVKKLPRELYCMELLMELLIDGTGIQEIYCQEGSLRNLEILSARNCKCLRDISTIGRLRKLSSLDLDGADIDGLPHNFEFPQRLERLSLRDCQKLVRLPTSIGKLDRLEVMDLSLTKITELPESVENLRNLKTLKMAHTSLRKFPRDIVNLKNLEEIDFSFCINLEWEVRCDISGLSSLRILRLSSSNVAGLPQGICHLSCLQTIDVRKCKQLQALPELPSSLFSLCWGSKNMAVPELMSVTNLKELCLSDDEPPEAGSSNKTPNIGWITRLTSLETLELSLPNVTNLPGNFRALTQLRELSLSYMKELDLTQLSWSSSLSTLHLKRCKFQEPKFSCLKYLSALELKNCELAEIDGLEDLKLLEVVKISDCRSLTNLDGLEKIERLRKVRIFSSPQIVLQELSACVEVDRCD
ncbi:hypothetical protein BT93_H2581 [Corymbia citriodora subsp. variegata]|nr:hypothetical protein BT93_H2581 [Corymbia citriodora subsp. variegata]